MNGSSELHFGNTCLDLSRRRLLLDGKPAKLGARAFDLLAALAQRRERAVSKHELFELVWPGVVVEENNLQVQISTLRKLLGADAIATIPGRGYQFTPELQTRGEMPAGPALVAEGLTNLPPELPPLYGRSADVQAVRALLDDHRLVTLVGAGGIGKTLLGRAVADRARGHYRDGVWWVELAALSDGALVPAGLAQALKVTLAVDRPPLDAVAAALGEQEALLVIDNCEHLIDAVAECVDRLLREAGAIRILATSQEALKVPQEAVYRVGSLGVDARGGEQVGGAVELFIARARAADPRLEFDALQLATAVEICRRLDGMPLAIELAAARVPLLGLDGLHARLDERFHILTGGARTVLRRHQTLRAALEWSHGLLEHDEQIVFRRLGVFTGGFSLELAQDVVTDERIDRWVALDLLGHLVDKSLVVAEGAGVPRYRLLESTRAFALEQLAAAGETNAWLRRHATALVDMLAAYYPSRWSHTEAQRSRLAAELDNVRAAIGWARGAEKALGCTLMGYAHRVWLTHGLHEEGIEHCLRLLPLPPGLPLDVEARFHATLGALGYLGARVECFDAALHAAELFRELGDVSAELDVRVTVALIGSRRGDRSIVDAAVADARRLLRPDAPARQRATVPLAEALWHLMCGRHREAVAKAEEQREIYRGNGDEVGFWLAETNASYYQCGLGEFDAAIARLERALPALRRLEAAYGPALTLSFLTTAHTLRGDAQTALGYARDAVRELRKQGWTHWLLQTIALAHAKLGSHTRAAQLLGYVEANCARLGVVGRPLEALVHDEVVERVNAALGVEEAGRLRRAGGGLSEEAAVAMALAEAQPAAAARVGGA
jgi:predicted ATPase/DNA-binding winged helix-turn-helix (wHTH) protein